MYKRPRRNNHFKKKENLEFATPDVYLEIMSSCTRKTSYVSKRQAEIEAEKLEAQNGKKLRVYSCKHCSGFHLTHKEELRS